jgi:hypothetical protein
VDEDLVAAGGGSAAASVEVEAAIARHAAFCQALFCRSPAAAERLIAAVRRLLRSENGRNKKASVQVVLELQEA